VKEEGGRIAAYGAPAKGAVLLNYCGIDRDFLDYTVDRNPRKQGHVMPVASITIHEPERIFETRPDFVLLPCNLREEIMEQMAGIRERGGRFIVPCPSRPSFHEAPVVKSEPLGIHGTWIIDPEPIRDARGGLARIFYAETFVERSLCSRFDQVSWSQICGRGPFGACTCSGRLMAKPN
jgi:hypothetical protein